MPSDNIFETIVSILSKLVIRLTDLIRAAGEFVAPEVSEDWIDWVNVNGRGKVVVFLSKVHFVVCL